CCRGSDYDGSHRLRRAVRSGRTSRPARCRGAVRGLHRPHRRIRRAALMPGGTPEIASVLVIGSGPIVIGQACEFDYSGTQACRVLKDEGLRVILINSNPATIMTDHQFADATYVEPITAEFVEKVIAAERPDALLATLGGQTALHVALQLHDDSGLDRYAVELIGVSIEAINRRQHRLEFRSIVESLPDEMGAEVARSRICHSMSECIEAVSHLKYPVVIRPSYTMGGAGGGIA